MHRVKFFILTLIIGIAFSSCGSSDCREPSSTASTDDSSASVSLQNVDEIEIGMSYGAVAPLIEKYNLLCYRGYLFYHNSEGENVVAEFDANSNVIKKIEVYHPVEPTQETIQTILPDMTVFDVVERIGLPFQSSTSGLSALDFKNSEGEVYYVLWGRNMTVINARKNN